ncbi:MAG: hypothetical protein QOJ67_1622 [Acidimicrobiaceae bacterium]
MQTSSASTGPDRGSPLRRYGPVVAIVVVIAVIAAIVAFSGKDDKKPAATSSGSNSSNSSNGALPAGAITFNSSKGRTDLTFLDTCDKETGRVALPYAFTPECFANVANNGGATAKGVTGETITVVVYLAPDVDPVLDYITQPINNNDTADQIQATYEGYTALFQKYMQTYGRKVQLKFLHGSGGSDSEVTARADAVKAVDELGAFAVWGGPVLAPAWTEEIKARGVICLACPSIKDLSPSVFPIGAGGAEKYLQLSEYVTKKLKDKPAEFAGDPAFKTQNRSIGELYISTPGSTAEADAAGFRANLAKGGVTLKEQLPYRLDQLIAAPEIATTLVSKLKASGVTTVILSTDPIAPKAFTEEATKQNYFPEWVYGNATLVDTAAFGRTYDQTQWAHAFGISMLAVREVEAVSDRFDLYRWFTGTKPPAPDTAPVLWPQPGLFFAGLQAAGPNLTVDTFRQGLFSGPPSDKRIVSSPLITYGDHGLWPDTDYYGIDDFVEIWWDPTQTGPDEIHRTAPGLIRFVDGGKRYRLGEWTSELNVFKTDGSVTLLTELSANEAPKEYPSPAGGSSSSSSAN